MTITIVQMGKEGVNLMTELQIVILFFVITCIAGGAFSHSILRCDELEQRISLLEKKLKEKGDAVH